MVAEFDPEISTAAAVFVDGEEKLLPGVREEINRIVGRGGHQRQIGQRVARGHGETCIVKVRGAQREAAVGRRGPGIPDRVERWVFFGVRRLVRFRRGFVEIHREGKIGPRQRDGPGKIIIHRTLRRTYAQGERAGVDDRDLVGDSRLRVKGRAARQHHIGERRECFARVEAHGGWTLDREKSVARGDPAVPHRGKLDGVAVMSRFTRLDAGTVGGACDRGEFGERGGGTEIIVRWLGQQLKLQGEPGGVSGDGDLVFGALFDAPVFHVAV